MSRSRALPRARLAVGALLMAAAASHAADAQATGASGQPDPLEWAATFASRFVVTPNVAYAPGNADAQLDVIVPRAATSSAPAPVLIYVHGGGWRGGLGVRARSEERRVGKECRSRG